VYTTAAATYVTFRASGAFCLATGGGDLSTLQITAGTPPTLTGAWCATAGSGSPMVTTSDGQADAIVWQMGAENDNHLHAFDGDTGAPLAFPGRSVTIPGMRRYNAPIAAKGRIYVAADGAVVAFKP
jgi:outer membrane protein assembly factor BamB